MKQRKSAHDIWAVFIDVHKWLLSPDHMVRQAAKAARKLQNAQYDGEKEGWDWDKYVTLHKKYHTIMESLTDHGYSGIEDVVQAQTVCILADWSQRRL